MYVSVRDGGPRTATALPRRRDRLQRATGAVSPTVVTLGLVSLLTDVSTESVNAVLPLYLTGALGLSVLTYGFVDGSYQAVSALLRLAGGWLADRCDRPKWVAAAGYVGATAARAVLVVPGGLALLAGALTVDRLGKGLRTAPRDALIAAASPPDALGRAFGVHRALDTLGALLGPLLASAMLLASPRDYRSVFAVSLAAGVLGCALLLLMVPDVRRPALPGPALPGPALPGPGLPRPALPRPAPGARPLRALLQVPGYRRLLLAAALLSTTTVGDGFLYLQLAQRDDLAAAWFPLLLTGTGLTYLALAVPLGALADRVGRRRVFLGGHVVLLAAYLCAGGWTSGPAATLACLGLLGAYYAATDGVLAAAVGLLVEPAARATGIAGAQTVVAVGRAVASGLFGLLWVELGRTDALRVFSALLLLALPVGAVLLRRPAAPAAP